MQQLLLGKAKMEAEKEEKLNEHKMSVDKKLNEKLKLSELEKAKVLDDLQSKIQALNIESTDKEILMTNLQNARTDKENKQTQLLELVTYSGLKYSNIG